MSSSGITTELVRIPFSLTLGYTENDITRMHGSRSNGLHSWQRAPILHNVYTQTD